MVEVGKRASAIIINGKEILLMHRKKEGREYWVFPGGGIEGGETGEQTALREIKEETGLEASNPRLAFRDVHPWDQKLYPFYSVDVEYEKPKLGGPEAGKHSENDWYHPEWVSLSEVPKINLVPETAKEKLLKMIK
jgi:8-oxo-dGTP diphosphatase